MVAVCKDFNGVKYILSKAIKKQQSKESLDSIFLVCGEEGSGKSTFILNCYQYLEEYYGKEANINQLARTLREFIITLKGTPDKYYLGLDEGTELSSDRQWDKIVKALKKAFTVMREKALIVFLAYTNPFKINTYFREDRSKGIFFVHKRKYVYFFTRKRFQQIQDEMKKKNSGIKSIGDFIDKYHKKATLVDTFPDYTGHLLKDYKARKTTNIADIFDELFEDFAVKEKGKSLNQVAKDLGVGKKLIAHVVELGIATPKTNATRTKYIFTKEDIDKIDTYIRTTESTKTVKINAQYIKDEKKVTEEQI